MSDRHVKFQVSTSSSKGSPKGRRSRELGHDSGVGSSSSGQASFGGRPDRGFTAGDYEDQLYSVGALQEALGQANQIARENDKLYREECDRNQRLERINKELEAEKIAQAEQIKELKAAYDEMRDERDEYRQRYLKLVDPVIETTMRGGSGEPSSPRHHQKESKSTRKHGEHREEKATSSRHNRRSSSLSVNTGTRTSSKKPYIEKMPSSPSSRYSGHYTVGPADSTDPAYYSNTPRSPYPPAAAPSYHGVSDIPPTGNYIQYPLYEHHGRRII